MAAGRPGSGSARPIWPRRSSVWMPGRTMLRARLEALLVPKDPNEGKDVIVEIRAGTGGEEAALWAGDLFEMYRRLAERHRWKTDVIASLTERPRRASRRSSLEVRGKDAFATAQARGRGPPRAAGAGHRVAGADPHVDGDGGGACPRPRRSRSRSAPRTSDRRLPLERPRRPVGEHDRLGGAHRPHADRHQGGMPGGALAAAEPGEGDALPARPAVRRSRTTKRRRRRRPSGARSSAPGSAPRRSAPTTSPRGA